LQHSKNLRLDCFYIGEHRTFTDDIDSALARQVVLSFSGEGLTIRARLERQPRQRDAPQNEGATEGDDGADGPETAMGDFLVVDTTVEASNMLVTAVSTRGDDAKQQPAHPIGSAAKMVYVKGESLQLEAEGPASGRLGPASGRLAARSARSGSSFAGAAERTTRSAQQGAGGSGVLRAVQGGRDCGHATAKRGREDPQGGRVREEEG